MRLFNNELVIYVPEIFESMTGGEMKNIFRDARFNHAFIDRSKNAVIGIALKDEQLYQNEVEQKIKNYYILYSRLAPGFVFGELKLRSEKNINTGILTFKSNAPARDLFNLVSVSNFHDKELFIMFSCNIQDSIYYFPRITNIINEMKISET